MKRNVASQVIGAQMITAADGSAFTGSVTVAVTGDAGTQATGSVGSGACTHEGNGFHTYAPAQAETNYDHVAFTFTGSGAIPATVQVYTTFPQTGDSYARLGAPAGASVSADVAAVKAETASILTDTAEIGAAGAGLTVLATAAALATVDSNVDDILTDTGTTLPATLSTIAGYVDTEVAAVLAAVDTEVAAIKATTDKLDDTLEDDAGTYRFTTNALEQAPAGGGGTSDWNADERTAIRTILGIPASGTTPDVPTAGALKVIDDLIDTEVASVLAAVDTEVAAILADTNELQTDWANGGRLDLILDARASQTSVDTVDDLIDTEVGAIKTVVDAILVDTGTTLDGAISAIDTVVDAIKAKTDSLTFTVAGQVDANIQSVNDVTVAGTGATGDEWGPA